MNIIRLARAGHSILYNIATPRPTRLMTTRQRPFFGSGCLASLPPRHQRHSRPVPPRQTPLAWVSYECSNLPLPGLLPRLDIRAINDMHNLARHARVRVVQLDNGKHA